MPESELERQILLGDPDFSRRSALADALTRAGLPVMAVASGAEALAFLRQTSTAVVLLDDALPGVVDVLRQASVLPARPTTILLVDDAAEDDPFEPELEPDQVWPRHIRQEVLVRRVGRAAERMAAERMADVRGARQARALLTNGSTALDGLFSLVPVNAAYFDVDGRPLFASPMFRQALGWLSSDLAELGSGFEHEYLRPILEHLRVESLLNAFELNMQDDDRNTRHFVATGLKLDGADERAGYLVCLEDMSHARSAADAERDQRALAEGLRETAAILARSLDPQSVMTQLLRSVSHLVAHETANVMLVDDDVLRVGYLNGYTLEAERRLLGDTIELRKFPTLAAVVQRYQTVVVDDVRLVPGWEELPISEDARALLAVPLRAYGRVIGVMILSASQAGAFGIRHIEAMRAFADQAAVALENAQLYDAIYRDAAKLRTLNRATSSLLTTSLAGAYDLDELYRQIAAIIVSEFADTDCCVIIHEPGSSLGDLHPKARAGEFKLDGHGPISTRDRGLIPFAFKSGESILAPDVTKDARYKVGDERTRSEVVIPLQTAQGIIGVIDMQSMRLHAFNLEDVRILEAFAERAAIMIENVRLYRDIQRRVDERTTELNRVKERAEAILNSSSDSIVLFRPDGRIQQTNHAFNETFGYSSDGAYNLSFDSIAGPYFAELLRQAFSDCMDDGSPRRLEIVADRRDGVYFDADVIFAPVLQQGRVNSVVCSLRDISSHKKLERDLREALERERELNDFKSQFISRASHEFRTPLMMISTATDLLRVYGGGDTVKRNEKLDSIRLQVRHITLMLDELLTLSRAQELGKADLQWAEVNIDELCQDVIQELRGGVGQHHQFEYYATGHQFVIRGDFKWLRRALVNLISNAIKYSDAGAYVRITVTSTPDQLSIRVQDEGLGIPEEDQERLFEPFHRARNVEHISGTGLGLSIVKQAAELHGGQISVQSRVGAGSSFTITLPQPIFERPV